MKKKSAKVFLAVLLLLIAAWGAMFTTDFIRSTSLRPPVSAAPEYANDNGDGTYKGIFYTVDLRTYSDAEHGVCIESVTMRFLGRVVAASIT